MRPPTPISAARPGARRETLETYIKRLESLERIAESKKGVEKSYAIQAGREIRVMVKPGEIDDDAAALLAREIASEIEGSSTTRARSASPSSARAAPSTTPSRRTRRRCGAARATATAIEHGPAARYYLRTFGCQMNEHDAERIRALLEAKA